MVTSDQLKARRHAREIVGELRWRGMTVPPLYACMADEFEDLVRSGDYASWVTDTDREFLSHPGTEPSSHEAVGRSRLGPFGPGRSRARSGSCLHWSTPGRE
jgi:hypothetical protein